MMSWETETIDQEAVRDDEREKRLPELAGLATHSATRTACISVTKPLTMVKAARQ